jgi:DNA-binding NtrC family response regulator
VVLLVDDDNDLLEVLGLLFSHAKLEYVVAHSLAEAKRLEESVPKLTTAILDVNLGNNMPTGVDVAKWLRSLRPDLRIVMFTGHAPDHPLVVEATGSYGKVLSKPIDARQLIAIARGS